MRIQSSKVLINYTFYLVSLFFVIYLVNVVPDDLVWDRFNYYVFFDNSSDYLQRMEGIKDYLRGEYVFHYLNNFIYSMTGNPVYTKIFYLTFIAFGFTFLLFYHSKNIFIYLLSLLISFFILPLVHLNIVALRQAFALYIFLFFFSFCKDKRINLFVLFFVSLIHNSFFYIFIIYFINFFIISEGRSFNFRLLLNGVFFLITAFLFIIVGQILGFSQIADVYSLYGARGVGATFLFVLFIFIIFYSFFKDDRSNKFYILLMLGLLNYLIFSIFVNASIAARYYEIYLPIIFIFLASKFNRESLIVFLVLFLFYFMFHFSVENLRSVYNINTNIFDYIF